MRSMQPCLSEGRGRVGERRRGKGVDGERVGEVRWEGVERVLAAATHLVILVLDTRPRDAFGRIEILLRFEDELEEELQSTRDTKREVR